MKHLNLALAVILTSSAMTMILRSAAVAPAPVSLTFDDDSNTGVFMLNGDEISFVCRGELVDVAYAPGVRACWDRYINQQQCGENE